MREQRQRLLLIALVVAAFALRVYRLEAQSLWYDEGVTAWLAGSPVAEMVRWTAGDIQPPLYYLIVSAWARAAGMSEYALRWPSVFAGLLAVPLLYCLVRSWASRGAALWAAALASFHPLLVYYAQEARMYSPLLALSLLAAILLTPSFRGSMRWPRWLTFSLAAALAAYTHYFAFLVIAALAAAWLIEWQRHRTGLGRFLVAGGSILLLYAPWLAAMFDRWATDASYWQGSLKLWEALRDIGARFTTGETFREETALWVTLALAVFTVGMTIWLWRDRESLRPLLRFAILWLLVPVAGTLALASTAPKFNARYVLIALPGVLILWALGLDALSSRRGPLSRLALAGAAALLFVPFVAANRNWFHDYSFNKAHWRQMAEFLQQRLAPGERVILVSGHAWPVWEYYAPDVPVIRLPEIDVLDVNHVLTFEETAPPLRAGLGDNQGAWLVGWQEEVVDPNGVVPVQLELGGREKGSSAQFNQLSLRRWSRIRIARIADSPPISVTVGATFGDQVTLVGYRPLDNGDLLLFWQRTPQSAADADYQVALEVFDAAGQLVVRVPDRRLGGYTYPSFRWGPDEIVMGQLPARAWLGDEPAAGTYQIRVGVYDAASPAQALLPLLDGSDTLVVDGVTSIIE